MEDGSGWSWVLIKDVAAALMARLVPRGHDPNYRAGAVALHMVAPSGS